MTTRKSVPDLLHGALECAIADGQWTAAVSIAIELRQWRAARSRLDLTEAETAALDDALAVTTPDDDRAEEEPLKVGDRVRITRAVSEARERWVNCIGILWDMAGPPASPYLFRMSSGASLWVARDEIERVEPESERLKFGQWVRLPDDSIGIALDDDRRPGKCYFVCLEKGRDAHWFHPDDLTPIEPQL